MKESNTVDAIAPSQYASRMATEPRRVGRKLLIASIGVATVSYVGCGNSTTSPKSDAAVDAAQLDGGSDGSTDTQGTANDAADASMDRQFTGNVIPP